METVQEIKTPIGTGTIQYGEFMSNDGKKNKYHCWWAGCGIGGASDTMKESKEHLIEYIRGHLTNKMNELEEMSADIRIFLREL